MPTAPNSASSAYYDFASICATPAFLGRIADLDAKANQAIGYEGNTISDHLSSLRANGSALVGWREQCGRN
jgi:hypothetical protein